MPFRRARVGFRELVRNLLQLFRQETTAAGTVIVALLGEPEMGIEGGW